MQMFKAHPFGGSQFVWCFLHQRKLSSLVPLCRPQLLASCSTLFPGSLVWFTPCSVSLLESQHPWWTGTLLACPACGPKGTNSGSVGCTQSSLFPCAYQNSSPPQPPCLKHLQAIYANPCVNKLEISLMCHGIERKYRPSLHHLP